MQNRANATSNRVSGLSDFNSLPFQNRLLRPTLSRPVWIRAEVVETEVASTESGTMRALGFVAQLKITLTEWVQTAFLGIRLPAQRFQIGGTRQGHQQA